MPSAPGCTVLILSGPARTGHFGTIHAYPVARELGKCPTTQTQHLRTPRHAQRCGMMQKNNVPQSLFIAFGLLRSRLIPVHLERTLLRRCWPKMRCELPSSRIQRSYVGVFPGFCCVVETSGAAGLAEGARRKRGLRRRASKKCKPCITFSVPSVGGTAVEDGNSRGESQRSLVASALPDRLDPCSCD